MHYAGTFVATNAQNKCQRRKSLSSVCWIFTTHCLNIANFDGIFNLFQSTQLNGAYKLDKKNKQKKNSIFDNKIGLHK